MDCLRGHVPIQLAEYDFGATLQRVAHNSQAMPLRYLKCSVSGIAEREPFHLVRNPGGRLTSLGPTSNWWLHLHWRRSRITQLKMRFLSAASFLNSAGFRQIAHQL